MKLPLLISLILIQLLSYSCRSVPEELGASDKIRLVWTDDPATSITVAWDQTDATNAEVFYGPVDKDRRYWKYPESQVAQTEMNRYDMKTRFAAISGLLPGTNYYFIIKDLKGVSKRYWFKTAPGKPEAFTFVVGGDTKSIGEALEAGRASNRLVAKLRPLFVLFNGDFTSGIGTDPDNWKTWLEDWQDLTTGADGRMIPIIPVMGNHEKGNKRNLNIIFNTPYQYNDTSHVYYSLNVGGKLMHIMALNTEVRVDSLQKNWLVQDLNNHSDFQFKVAAYHKPFFPHTQGKKENLLIYRSWANTFYKHGLDLSFDADSHMHKITFPVRPDSSEAAYMGFVRDDKPWTLTSGSFNQIKWIHVIPETQDMEAHIDIYTVISCEYDADTTQIFYDDIEALSEDNLFSIPEGIRLHQMEKYGTRIRYPFLLNN